GGTITGNLALTKQGAGTLTLSSANTYTGTTTVSAGVLNLTGSLTSNVAVGGTGTLGGTGTVNSANTVTVNNGGTVAPGPSPGLLNTGNVSFAAGSTFVVEIGGTTVGQYDQLNVTGTVSLGGATLSASTFLFIPSNAIQQTFRIINNDSTDAVTGTFAG